MKKLSLPVLLLLFPLLFLAFPSLALEVGKTPPDFKLTTFEGKDVRLSDYKGQVIILKLATTWCPTCKQQSAAFLEAGDFLKEKNVQVVEVFLQDSEAMIKEYLRGKHYQMPFVALLDDGQVYKAYNVYLIPRVLFIDQDFVVRRDGSLMEAGDLKKMVETLLAKSH